MTHDKEADAVYVYLSDRAVEDTEIVDDCRFVHFDEEGYVRGLELLNVAAGVRLADLPIDVPAMSDLLRAHQIPVVDLPTVHGSGVLLCQVATAGSAQVRATTRMQPLLLDTKEPQTKGFEPEEAKVGISGMRANLPPAESRRYAPVS